jgi:hypothetical protein
MMVNLGRVQQRRRLHIHVAVVMGNQKSQDYLCGRKGCNLGNVGWVHWSCMVSAIQPSDISTTLNHDVCRLANADMICQLKNMALDEVCDTAVKGPLKTINDSLP